MAKSPASISIMVDQIGRMLVSSIDANNNQLGLKIDGSGRSTDFSATKSADVRPVIREILAAYGHSVESIAGDAGGVTASMNHPKVDFAIAVLAAPRLGMAARRSGSRFEKDVLFDARDFDPKMAIDRMATIGEDAKLDTKPSRWEYRRPAAGVQPHIAYDVAGGAPTDYVWVDDSGKVIHIGDGSDHWS